MNLLRRHPIAVALIALVLLSALDPLPPLLDAASGTPAFDADLVRPATYTVLAPLSDAVDALTFLSLERARWFLVFWVGVLALWGLLRRGSLAQRLGRAVVGPVSLVLLGLAAAVLPRPVPQLLAADSTVTVIDYHAHTNASHDGRRGWRAEDLAAWHAAQGFAASYVTDHNVAFTRHLDGTPIPLLPGVEWSVYQQHVIALGDTLPIDRAPYERDTPGM